MLKLSANRNMMVFMTSSSDHVSGVTGLSAGLTIVLSKDGGNFSTITPTVTEPTTANGWYNLALTTTHTNTLGDFVMHITGAGADPADIREQVVTDLPGDTVSSVTGNVSGNVTGSVGSVVAIVSANLTQILGTALTETAGLLAGGFKKFFNVSSPTGTLNSIPDVVAGATNGLFIAGTNAATTVTTSLTTTFTGNVTGSVGSVTGNVGGNVVGSVASVTGNVGGNVVGTVASVVGNVGGNVVGSVGSVVATVAANLTQILGTALTETAGQLAAGFKQFFNIASPTSTMNLITAVTTVTTTTTATNLTTNNDKTGYALSTAGTQAIWDKLTSALTTSGSIGKLIVDNLNASISSVIALLPSALVGGRIDASIGSYQSGLTPLQPTVAGRTLDVATTGEAGLDFDNIKDATAPHTLTNITVPSVTTVGSVSGSVGSVTGSVGSVVGAVGSVTGNVGGNVVGTVASVVGNVGGNVVGTVASVVGAVGSVAGNVVGSVGSVVAAVTISAGSVQAIWDALTSALTTTGSIGKLLVDNITASISSVAGAVWDIVLASHLTPGSTGNALNAAGSAGDPWATMVPGAYGSGTAGNIVGNRLDVAVSTRLATAGYTAPDNADIILIKAKTDNLPADPASNTQVNTRAPASTALDNTVWTGAKAAFIDVAISSRNSVAPDNSGIAAIKSQTDQLVFVSGNVNANAQVVSDKTGYSLAPGQIPIKKNTALAGFTFPMFDSSGSPMTGLSITSQRSIDGAALASTTNVATEVGSGLYAIDLSAADLNGNSISFLMNATGAAETAFTMVTQ